MIISSQHRLGIKSKSNCKTVICKKEKNQTVLERKQQMGHLTTPCPAFILLERSIWGCSLARRGTIRQYRVLKWLEILGLQQSF